MINGGDSDQNSSELHPQVISKYIDAVVGEMFAAYRKEGGDISQFLKTYPSVAVQYDDDRDEKFIETPARLMKVDGAMHSITYRKNRQNPIPVLMSDGLGIYGNLDVSSTMTMAYLEGDKVFFLNLSDAVESLHVRMLVTSESLNDDDDILVPEEMTRSLINDVYSAMIGQIQVPEDRVNDGDDKR